VDQSKFQDAQQAYDAGDYRAAAKLFLASANRGPAGNGAAYHMAGNALMRLRRYHDAVTVYGHALRDDAYDRTGAVHANLGAAYAALGEYAQAEHSYDAALDDPGYTTRYKALQGLASALLERGKVEDAAVAYRTAALDPGNPDPGKALVNLGLCFMALGRPSDAAEAYKAALGFDDYAGRGKALANLGLAYTQMGQYDEAVRAFEKATQMHTHPLSAAAQHAYDTALSMTRPAHETVDGWVTGEMSPVSVGDGWGTGDLQSLSGGEVLRTPVPAASTDSDTGAWAVAETDPYSEADAAAARLGFGDDTAVNEFFTRTEDEMKQRDRAQRRATGGGSALRSALVIVALVLVLGALVGGAYMMGFGWPTQSDTTKRVLEAYKAGQQVTQFWVAVPDKDVAKEMAKVPPVDAYEIGAVRRGRNTSAVSVTVTPQNGAPLRYTFILAREGVGWKVSGIENEWRSTGD
jgi:tetratricopeptide (TPR) repeat protein/phage terminase large subunit-like protein